MQVLIVESRPTLARLWANHLRRRHLHVQTAEGEEEATRILAHQPVDIIILDVVLWQGSALAVCDYASYRRPEARVIFVTSSSFFSDGSIFAHASNARAIVPVATAPEDLVAMVQHYAAEGSEERRA